MEAPTDPIPRDLRRVLVLMIDHHMGNFVVSLPVIEQLLSYFDQPPDLMVDERYAPLAALLPSVGNVLPYPGQARKRRSLADNVSPALVMARAAARRYEAVFDLGGGQRAAVLVLATCAARRIGFLDAPLSQLYTRRIARAPKLHAYERYATILRSIGYQSLRPPLIRLRAPAHAVTSVKQILESQQSDPTAPIAVLHPGAGKEYRQWPADRFAAVADELVRRHGMNICIIGAPSDRALADSVMAAMQEHDSGFFLVLPLDQLLALFERASVIVSNEGGPTHLAATTDLPIVTIFGPSKEREWRPLREQNTVILRGAECDPRCGRRVCHADRRCLLSLSPQTVYAAAEELLRGANETRAFTPLGAAAAEAG